MEWTKELPSEPGYYWYRSRVWSKPCVVRVEYDHGRGYVWFAGDSEELQLSNRWGYWWPEPIQPPKIEEAAGISRPPVEPLDLPFGRI